MVYVGICDKMSPHREESSHKCAVSEVLNGSYCNRNADSGTEADRAK